MGGTAAVSATLGALSGRSIERSLAIGYYVVGAAVLVGSFALGSRGPWRADTETETEQYGAGSQLGPRLRRRRRRATPEERAEGRRSSVGLFALGIGLVLVGALFDPARRPF